MSQEDAHKYFMSFYNLKALEPGDMVWFKDNDENNMNIKNLYLIHKSELKGLKK